MWNAPCNYIRWRLRSWITAIPKTSERTNVRRRKCPAIIPGESIRKRRLNLLAFLTTNGIGSAAELRITDDIKLSTVVWQLGGVELIWKCNEGYASCVPLFVSIFLESVCGHSIASQLDWTLGYSFVCRVARPFVRFLDTFVGTFRSMQRVN